MRCTGFAKAGVGYPPKLLAVRVLTASLEGCRPGLACLPELGSLILYGKSFDEVREGEGCEGDIPACEKEDVAENSSRRLRCRDGVCQLVLMVEGFSGFGLVVSIYRCIEDRKGSLGFT
jgi:hypothetical protein